VLFLARPTTRKEDDPPRHCSSSFSALLRSRVWRVFAKRHFMVGEDGNVTEVSGYGLVTYGIAARWGDGSICLEPGVGSVPFDTEFAARRAAFRDLIASLEAGRGAAKHQQRQLLLAEVKERDRERGLFG
jgi:hypothetical protein